MCVCVCVCLCVCVCVCVCASECVRACLLAKGNSIVCAAYLHAVYVLLTGDRV